MFVTSHHAFTIPVITVIGVLTSQDVGDLILLDQKLLSPPGSITKRRLEPEAH
jgi:hypothetical protein